jgi:DNA repair protein RecO
VTINRYSSEGIVLASKNYRESDRIIVLYTKKLGKKTYLAKGVRKPKSRKRGGLEVFSYLKYSAVSAKGFEILTEVELIDGFTSLRGDLKSVSLAYYFTEVIGRISSENEPNNDAYKLLLESIRNLHTQKDLKKVRVSFITDVLVIFGFWEKDRALSDPDALLTQVLEKDLNSVRVGKKILS